MVGRFYVVKRRGLVCLVVTYMQALHCTSVVPATGGGACAGVGGGADSNSISSTTASVRRDGW